MRNDGESGIRPLPERGVIGREVGA